MPKFFIISFFRLKPRPDLRGLRQLQDPLCSILEFRELKPRPDLRGLRQYYLLEIFESLFELKPRPDLRGLRLTRPDLRESIFSINH